MQAHDQPGLGWTVVLRRQPVRIVEGQPEGGYTDAYESLGLGGAGFPRNLGGGAAAGGHGPALLATGVLPVRWPAP